MAITDWPSSERPRERLLDQGATHLTDAELLAIFLRVGVKGKSAVDLAREMLTSFGSLKALMHAPLEQFVSIHGLGPAKFVQLQASLELSRRAMGESLRQSTVLNNPDLLQQFIRLKIAHYSREVFYVVLLNAELALVHEAEMFQGTIGQAAVYPREIVKLVLKHNASAVVLAHNHPSGSLVASQADIAVTSHIKSALATVDVRLLDHIIVSTAGFYSFHQSGLL